MSYIDSNLIASERIVFRNSVSGAWRMNVRIRRLDATRRGLAGSTSPPRGALVFEAADLDPTEADLLDWIAYDRDLGSTRIQDIPSVLR